MFSGQLYVCLCVCLYICMSACVSTIVVPLTLEVLYPLTSNTRILKEIVIKGLYFCSGRSTNTAVWIQSMLCWQHWYLRWGGYVIMFFLCFLFICVFAQKLLDLFSQYLIILLLRGPEKKPLDFVGYGYSWGWGVKTYTTFWVFFTQHSFISDSFVGSVALAEVWALLSVSLVRMFVW